MKSKANVSSVNHNESAIDIVTHEGRIDGKGREKETTGVEKGQEGALETAAQELFASESAEKGEGRISGSRGEKRGPAKGERKEGLRGGASAIAGATVSAKGKRKHLHIWYV